MNFGRYKYRDWKRVYGDSCNRLRGMIGAEVPKCMIQSEARLLLNACHGGPWKAMAHLLKYEILGICRHYGFRRWEWIRTRIFRRAPDDAIAQYERVCAEEEAVAEMMREL